METKKDSSQYYFLFRYVQFRDGVRFFDKAQVGEYILLLCEQADGPGGSIPEKIFNKLCEDPDVREKFEQDSNGWFNVRLRETIAKSNAKAQNRLGKTKEPKPHAPVKEAKEEPKKKNKERTAPIKMPWTDPIFINQWTVWKDYKKEQHAFIYKPIGEQSALTALKNDSGDNMKVALSMINQSMANGYKGIFKLKPETPGFNVPENKRPTKKIF